MHTPSQRIYENILIFQKSKLAEHHLLLEMNVLQHALLDFALKRIRFPFIPQKQTTARKYDGKNCITIQLNDKILHYDAYSRTVISSATLALSPTRDMNINQPEYSRHTDGVTIFGTERQAERDLTVQRTDSEVNREQPRAVNSVQFAVNNERLNEVNNKRFEVNMNNSQ